MKVLLTFTYGISLEDWNNWGLIFREISFYKKILENNLSIRFLTFGNLSDLRFSNVLGSIKITPVQKIINSKLPKFHFIKSLFLPLKLKNIFNEIDLIKTNQIRGCWIACVAKILYKKKLIIRGGYEWLSRYRNFSTKKGIKNYLKYMLNYIWIFLNELIAYKLADGIILTSKEDISFIVKCFKLKRKFKKQRIIHFFNFIDVDLFKPLYLPKRENHILYIGNLKKVKNLVNLIKAFKDLKGYCLDIIGKGAYKENLKNLVKELGLDVNFLGTYPNNKIPEILNQYEIFILPSYYEGNPKVLLEAMSCGIACIGSNILGINTIIKHKENGYLCGTSHNDIKNAIENLNADNDLRKKISKNARNFILNNCSLNSIAQEEYFFYEKILKDI